MLLTNETYPNLSIKVCYDREEYSYILTKNYYGTLAVAKDLVDILMQSERVILSSKINHLYKLIGCKSITLESRKKGEISRKLRSLKKSFYLVHEISLSVKGLYKIVLVDVNSHYGLSAVYTNSADVIRKVLISEILKDIE